MTINTPVLQFGTSRFLLAHADLFMSEALEKGEAVGQITVVQTTSSAASAARIAALGSPDGYPVRVRGLKDGVTIDEERRGKAVAQALTASTDWNAVRAIAIQAKVIISNTGDRGYELDSADTAALAADFTLVARSFPAKLTTLLYERFLKNPGEAISLYPCELIPRNGDRLKDIVRDLAKAWELSADFTAWLDSHSHFANSLVDRIVSEPIEPVGAVAEPYALWAIEAQPGLVLPCTHPSLVVTDDLDHYESLKLFILNLGHSYLAERWLKDKRPEGETVREAMADAALRADLETLWDEEVLPVLAAEGDAAEVASYRDDVRERFLNPFLAHRLADIAGNHEEKKRRRLGPVVALAEKLGLALPQTKLRAALA